MEKMAPIKTFSKKGKKKGKKKKKRIVFYCNITALRMGDLAADRPAWWCWAYLGLWQSSSQLQMISPILARWRWAYLGSAMLKPAKSLIVHILK